jgi:transglutaminase superfamily protein
MTTAYSELIRPMPLQEKLKLGREIVGTYALARWRLRRHDLPTALAAMRERYAACPSAFDDPLAEKYAAVRLGRAIGRTLSILPFDSKCLVRSLVLAELLARRGIESRVVIGVKPGPSFGAHAWVESIDGQALLEPLAHEHQRLVEI